MRISAAVLTVRRCSSTGSCLAKKCLRKTNLCEDCCNTSASFGLATDLNDRGNIRRRWCRTCAKAHPTAASVDPRRVVTGHYASEKNAALPYNSVAPAQEPT